MGKKKPREVEIYAGSVGFFDFVERYGMPVFMTSSTPFMEWELEIDGDDINRVEKEPEEPEVPMTADERTEAQRAIEIFLGKKGKGKKKQ